MKKIVGLASSLVVALYSMNASAARELYVWEDELGKSDGIIEAVSEFEKMYDCKVRVEEINFTEQIDKLRIEGPSGNGPDVLMLPSDKAGSAVSLGLITPIGFMQEDQDKYIPSAVSAFAVGGEIYGVPKVVETLVMYYNKDLLKEPFDTLSEYFDYSKSIVAKNDGTYGLLAKWDNFCYTFGGTYPYGSYVFGTDADGNLDTHDLGLSNDGAVAGVELIKSFYTSGCFPKEIQGENGIDAINTLFESGKAAAVINGPWRLEIYKKAGINYGVSPLPVLPNGKPMSSFLGVKGYVISTYAKDRDLAEAYLHFINQTKYAKIRYQISREIPPLKSIMSDPIITDDEIANAIAVQASRAVPLPSVPEMVEVWGPIEGAFKSILSGKQSVRDALKSATDHINYQIESYDSGR